MSEESKTKVSEKLGLSIRVEVEPGAGPMCHCGCGERLSQVLTWGADHYDTLEKIDVVRSLGAAMKMWKKLLAGVMEQLDPEEQGDFMGALLRYIETDPEGSKCLSFSGKRAVDLTQSVFPPAKLDEAPGDGGKGGGTWAG